MKKITQTGRLKQIPSQDRENIIYGRFKLKRKSVHKGLPVLVSTLLQLVSRFAII